jgi:hypothetical protein
MIERAACLYFRDGQNRTRDVTLLRFLTVTIATHILGVGLLSVEVPQ